MEIMQIYVSRENIQKNRCYAPKCERIYIVKNTRFLVINDLWFTRADSKMITAIS